MGEGIRGKGNVMSCGEEKRKLLYNLFKNSVNFVKKRDIER
jgi:hypothetical protein